MMSMVAFGDALFGERRSFPPATMSESSEPTTTATAAAATAASSSTTTTTTKKTGGVRLPSLNQLAARITSNQAAANGGTAPPLQPTTTSAPRPRLPAFALRTGSTTSVNTVTSNADSMAVNPSSTRSASPATSNASHQSAATTGGAAAGGDPLTTEGLDKLNQENTPLDAAAKVAAAVIPEAPKKKVGYKNIPSLDAITARLAKQRASQLSIDGSAMPPEPEMIEDPKTPGVPMKAPEHPLQFPWTIYHDTKAKFPYTPATAATGHGFNQPPPGVTSAAAAAAAAAAGEPPFSATHPPESTEYEAGLTVIGEFDTVEEFCRYFNWLKPPSKLEKNSNYHIFKSGIKPMWEDPANAEGGKWVLGWLAMALVGEELEENDEICGAVVSLRSKVDRIQVWTRSKEDRLIKLLDVSEADNIGLEFQRDRPPPNKFLSIPIRARILLPLLLPGPPAVPASSRFWGLRTGMGIGGQV
ncbi:eukaryotic translation initiation factor 4E-1A [Pholiota molesta]|nr:eukaryotic translation initiation factor 4E-1A [Pholiota molesta]